MDRMDAREQRRVDAIDMSIDFEEEDTIYESDFSNMNAPLPKPDRPILKNTFTEEPEILPDMMPDEDKLPINTNVEDEVNKATEFFLNGTTDTYLSDIGTLNTTFSESTGYNYSNVNLSDLPEAQYDLEAVKSAQTAAGVEGFFTGRSKEKIIDKQDEIANEAINKLTTG
jgi:hypothetical protein